VSRTVIESEEPEDHVREEERDERNELEQDASEDLQVDEESAEKVRGGKAKTADKAFNAMDAYIRG
jgi:hypothetical protein